MATENALKIAKRVIEETGYLDLPYRKILWDSLGGENYGKTGKIEKITEGLKRRFRLSELCVNKIIHIWEFNTNNDPRLQKIMELANSYLDGKVSSDVLNNELEKFNSFESKLIDNVFDIYPFVARAVSGVIGVALYDEAIFQVTEDDSKDDWLDHEVFDVAWMVCAIYSYSDTGLLFQDYDDKKRKEFWNWYVDEAIPSVLNS